MTGKTQNGMQCIEFEALLADALDGTLDSQRMSQFQGHAAGCPDCGPLLAESRAGLQWMKSLQEIEPPRHLVHNILAATTGAERRTADAAAPAGWWQRLRDQLHPVMVPAWAAIRQPRFAMSFGMAFFSLSLVLNLSGVKLRDLGHADLRPSAIRSGYYETQAKVVRYYENMRLVYELQSRMRDLRNATRTEEPEQPQAAPQPKEKRRDDNTSGQPEKRNQYYSADGSGVLLAALRDQVSNRIFPALESRDSRTGAPRTAASDHRRGA